MLVCLLLVVFFLKGSLSESRKEVSEGLDRQKALEVSASQQRAELGALEELRRKVESEMKEKLEEAGVNVRVLGNFLQQT